MQSQQALIHPPDTCQKVQAFPKRWGLRKVPPPSLRPLPEFPLVLFRRLLGDWVMRLNLDTVCVGPPPPPQGPQEPGGLLSPVQVGTPALLPRPLPAREGLQEPNGKEDSGSWMRASREVPGDSPPPFLREDVL